MIVFCKKKTAMKQMNNYCLGFLFLNINEKNKMKLLGEELICCIKVNCIIHMILNPTHLSEQ